VNAAPDFGWLHYFWFFAISVQLVCLKSAQICHNLSQKSNGDAKRLNGATASNAVEMDSVVVDNRMRDEDVKGDKDMKERLLASSETAVVAT
jgi:hypothetical protein